MPYPFCPVIPPSGFPIPVRKGDPSVRRREPALPPVHSLRRHRLGSTRRIRRSASSVHCSGGGDGVLKMTPSECPPWIDPGNAFKLVVKCAGYKAIHDYGIIEMTEQWHDLWVDTCSGYNLDNFVNDMASKNIWDLVKKLWCGY
nr:uncharacterized protein LOC117833468 isoform X3 [Setaria viridis]